MYLYSYELNIDNRFIKANQCHLAKLFILLDYALLQKSDYNKITLYYIKMKD